MEREEIRRRFIDLEAEDDGEGLGSDDSGSHSELDDFLDNDNLDDRDDLAIPARFRPSLANSLNPQKEAEAAESLAKRLDRQYGSRASQATVDASGTEDISDPNKHLLQRLDSDQTMFCWAARSSDRAQKVLGLLLDSINVSPESGRRSTTNQEDRIDLISTAFMLQHLPKRVFFLTRDLPAIRRFLLTKNFHTYDRDITIVAKEEWTSGAGWMPWVSSPIKLRSVVRIRKSGGYSGSLGFVMATSTEFGNESLVVAVVPRIPYPTTTVFSRGQDSPPSQEGPSRKRRKVDHHDSGVHAAPKATTSRPPARLFDLVHHHMYMGFRPPLITHEAPSEVTAVGDSPSMSLAKFFATPTTSEKPRFPPMDLLVPNEHGQLVDGSGQKLQKTTFAINCNELIWAGKPSLPVYEFKGDFFWKGLLLMPIYHYGLVDRAVISYSKEELLPFVEANIFPGIFGTLLSQLHWKRGDKIVEVSHHESADPTFQAIVFEINEILLEQGVVWATPIQLFAPDQQNQSWLSEMGFGENIDVEQQQVLSQDLRQKINEGRQTCLLKTHRLHLTSGDNVKVLVGKYRGLRGQVIGIESSYLKVLLHGSLKPVSVHRNWVETWEPSLLARSSSSDQWRLGQKVSILQGDYVDQEGYISRLDNDGIALVLIGQHSHLLPVSYLTRSKRNIEFSERRPQIFHDVLPNDVVEVSNESAVHPGHIGRVIHVDSNDQVVIKMRLAPLQHSSDKDIADADPMDQGSPTDPAAAQEGEEKEAIPDEDIADADSMDQGSSTNPTVTQEEGNEKEATPDEDVADADPMVLDGSTATNTTVAQGEEEEEEVTIDRAFVTVLLRVKIGAFLKVDNQTYHDRGTVTSIEADGQVSLMTDDGISLKTSLIRLKEIEAGYIGHEHPFVGKWVTIKPPEGLVALKVLKGREGSVRSHNVVQNTFVVDLTTLGDQTIPATAVWQRISNENVLPEKWRCADLQNGNQKQPEEQSEEQFDSHLAIRPSTPRPSSPLQGEAVDKPSAFDVEPGEAGELMAFLSESWADKMTSQYHFKLAFRSSYPVMSLYNRTALTIGSASSQDILLAFSDNLGKRKREITKLRYLAPASVTKVPKALKVVVMAGERRGQVFEVHSTNKKRQICKLRLENQKPFEEQWSNICVVLPHAEIGCECDRFPG